VRRGLPGALHVDDGPPYSNAALDRCCVVLGVRGQHPKGGGRPGVVGHEQHQGGGQVEPGDLERGLPKPDGEAASD
jgi:hypothetical protein